MKRGCRESRLGRPWKTMGRLLSEPASQCRMRNRKAGRQTDPAPKPNPASPPKTRVRILPPSRVSLGIFTSCSQFQNFGRSVKLCFISKKKRTGGGGVFRSCGLQLPASLAMLRGCLEQWIWGPARPLNPGLKPPGDSGTPLPITLSTRWAFSRRRSRAASSGGEKTEKRGAFLEAGTGPVGYLPGGEKSVAQPCLILKPV